MEIDSAMLIAASAGQSSARVYHWSSAWVSLGRNQTPETALLDSCSIPWVMRPTGGKAVLHGHDITLSIAVPISILRNKIDGAINQKSVVSVYRSLAPLIANAISRSGVECLIGEDSFHSKSYNSQSEDCFMLTSPNDIVEVSSGKKVCGCALRLTENAVLVQASIPVSEPLVNVKSVYNSPAEIYYISLDTDIFRIEFERILSDYLM